MRIATTFTLFIIIVSLSSAQALPFGVQSGRKAGTQTEDGGSSYGGSIAYDSDSNSVFVTGSSYGSFWSIGTEGIATNTSNCFLSILKLPGTEADSVSWLYTDRLGSTAADESCSTIHMIDGQKIYLGGQSEEGGLLTEMRNQGSGRADQYGTVIDIDVDFRPNAQQTSAELAGGRLIHNSPVQSTRAIASLPLGTSLFIVSLESDLSIANPNFDASNPQPDLIHDFKLGQDYFLTVEKLNARATPTGSGATLTSAAWTRSIATSLHSVHVAGLELMNDSTLLLSGSAIGTAQEAIPSTPISTNTDWDGFVTLFDPVNGLITNAGRIQTQQNRTDNIEGICRQRGAEDVVYLVGSTNGALEIDNYQAEPMTAFLIRLSVPELTVEWTKQIKGKSGPLFTNTNNGPEIFGLNCAVTDDGNDVYVGGITKDGAVIDIGGHQSSGKNDIWVGQVEVSTQEWKWTRQLGTSKDESLSDITVDDDGNVIVLGNTDGSFMRNKEGNQTDIFLISMTRTTGEYPVPFESEFNPIPGGGGDDTTGPTPTPMPVIVLPPIPGATPTSTPSPSAAPPVATPQPTKQNATPAPTPVVTPAPTAQSSSPGVATPAPTTQSSTSGATSGGDGGEGSSKGFAAVMVVLSTLGIIVGCFIWHRGGQYTAGKKGNSVFDVVRSFHHEVEVDVKQSATGGYHGTYVNNDGGPRYYSDDGMPDDDFITFARGDDDGMSPLTHSAIVESTLFSIDGGDPDTDRPSDRKLTRTYDSLVDVYNNTWNELSHHQLPERSPQSANTPLTDVDIRDSASVDSDDKGPWGREII